MAIDPDATVDLLAILMYSLVVLVALTRLLLARIRNRSPEHGAAAAAAGEAGGADEAPSGGDGKVYMSPLKRNFFLCVAAFGASRVVGEAVEFSVADDDAGALFSNRFRVFDCLAQCFFFSTYMSLVLYLVVHSADSERGVAHKVFYMRGYWVATGVFYGAVLVLYAAECAVYGWGGDGGAGGDGMADSSAAEHDPMLRVSAGVIALGSIICKVGFVTVGLRLHRLLRHFFEAGRGRAFSSASRGALQGEAIRITGVLCVCTALFVWRDTVYISYSLTGNDRLGDITVRPPARG